LNLFFSTRPWTTHATGSRVVKQIVKFLNAAFNGLGGATQPCPKSTRLSARLAARPAGRLTRFDACRPANGRRAVAVFPFTSQERTIMFQHEQTDAIPFTLVCCDCDAGIEIESEAEAMADGWTDIDYAPELPMANYVGLCPDCQERYEHWPADEKTEGI
jgi:hypothetical protein